MSSRAASVTENSPFVTEPEQLSLLTAPVNPRFQLSRETRARGLRHVAHIRQMLAAHADADSTSSTGTASTGRQAPRPTSQRAA